MAGAWQSLPPPPAPLPGNGWYRLAGVVRAALLLNALVYAVDVAGSWWAAHTLGSWLDDPSTVSVAEGQRIDTLNQATAVLESLLLLVTGVLFICWLYQAHGRPLAERSALSMGRGWAIGGWFIPLACYVIPYRVVQGVNSATTSPARPASRLVMGWWVGFVCFSVLGLVSRVITSASSGLHGRHLVRALQTADTWAAISAAPGVVAALLGALVVTQVTRHVREVATVSPIPAA